MFSSPENPDRQIDRMSGCARFGLWIWKWVIRLLVAVALYYLVLIVFDAMFGRKWQEISHQIIHKKITLLDLRLALGQFETEYGELPIKPDESKLIRSDGLIVFALLGGKCEANPRGIKFIDLPTARDGKFGLTGYYGSGEEATEDIALVDAWGERYYLLLESTGDNRIPNPERLPGATGKVLRYAQEFIPASSLIFSSGPDKNPSTWDDNICSWR